MHYCQCIAIAIVAPCLCSAASKGSRPKGVFGDTLKCVLLMETKPRRIIPAYRRGGVDRSQAHSGRQNI
eukprot:scaffold36630_cov20-Prasinocladus_malaysianus.AAC.1